jgi:hypothetical protein
MAATHNPPPVVQGGGYAELAQARANVFQVRGGWPGTGAAIGLHLSIGVSDVTVTDCTQGTLPQSSPAAMGFAAVQLPSQLGGGSKDVSVPSPAPQTNELAVSAAGSWHDPVGGSHEQAPQANGTSLGSAWPV